MSLLFSFKDAAIAIGNKTVLSDINWEVASGRHTWISGLNGAGKTTLCQALNGQLRITKGSAHPKAIDYNEIAMVSFTDRTKLFQSVNNHHYYQQRFNSWDADGHLTVKDYLEAHGADLNQYKHAGFIKNTGITELLELERIKLSSGQTRKMLLASALFKNPKLLILDNAYIGLDPMSRTILNNFLDQIALESDITIIISGHTTELPNCIEDHILIKKKRLYINHRNTTYADDEKLENSKIGIINNISKINHDGAVKHSYSELVNFENVDISYHSKQILNIPNWKINIGENWSVLGNNGSGKSTLVSMIYGDHPQAYSKSIRLFGAPLGKGRSIWEVKSLIGFTSPELHAYFHSQLSVRAVICTGLFDKFEIMGTVPTEKLEFARTMVTYFEIEGLLEKAYFQLSMGQQRLCLFIRALIKCPVLFLLDEPFQGLDFKNVGLAKNLLNAIDSDRQSIVFISHFVSEIPSCIDQTLNL